MLKTALHYSHDLLTEVIKEGDTVIDATVGNGHDTLFLAQLVQSTGHVIGFDIQLSAINETKKKLLEANLYQQVSLYHQGHETVHEVLDKKQTIKAAIFNLGYLPKSDKAITTHESTTLDALNKLLPHLEIGGRIILVVYYGHPGGIEEKIAVLDYVKKIPQETFNVLLYQFINQKNSPPILIAIERKK